MADTVAAASEPIRRVDLLALSRRWFEEVWNRRNDAVIDEMMAPGCVIHGLSEDGRTLAGAADFRRFYQPLCSALPDLRVNVEDVLVDGSQTAVRVTGTGTHRGEGLGIPPTSRPVRLSGIIIILRWDDSGRIVEGWNEFDAAGMQRQLTAPASPPVAVKAR